MLLLVGSSLLLTGCFTGRYLWQAAGGQLDMMARSRPIDLVIRDARTPLRTAELLGAVRSIKRYGERHGLTPTNNYQDYADLGRPAAVWVVSACDPLQFSSKSWSFPLVGSVPYLGWFDYNDARDFAADLARRGYDVDLRGASAYSTLGWFSDPVLSTMLSDGDDALGDLANVVLHESVHATVFLPNMADLNESVADFVADKLTPDYLAEARGSGSAELTAYLTAERESAARTELLHQAYAELEALYASDRSRADKLARKAGILSTLSARIEAKRPINNATLAQFRTYHGAAPELEALYGACGGDLSRFFAELRTLTHDAGDELAVRGSIARLAQAGCRVGADAEGSRAP